MSEPPQPPDPPPGMDAVLSMVWVNGEPQPPDAVHLSAHDRGFTLGDAVFETMRARGGAVFRLDRHLARLKHALAVLEIPCPRGLRDWVQMAAQTAGSGPASIRLTVTRGLGVGGLAPPPEGRATVIISAGPMPQFDAVIYEAGLRGHIASGRRNERAMTAGLKTVAYTDAVAALLEARRTGADEALFLDSEDHCSEATASNLFVVTGGTLLTPPLSCGALPGITRAAVMELARQRGLETSERAFGLDELRQAREAFLTSSLRGVAPLVRLGNDAIGDGTPGPVTRQLSAAYAELVGRECGV